ncbi:hypothetical protein Y886_14450 [Xanthomonas hyacinthi DSM 19077]|nr:hypothetical protein Y886_14450 [Xanthomonas hyacinthi DSM 19077]
MTSGRTAEPVDRLIADCSRRLGGPLAVPVRSRRLASMKASFAPNPNTASALCACAFSQC